MELIKQKLELDLFQELKEELDIDDTELKCMIKKEVDSYEFNFHKKNKNKYSSKKVLTIVVRLDYGTLITKRDALIKRK